MSERTEEGNRKIIIEKQQEIEIKPSFLAAIKNNTYLSSKYKKSLNLDFMYINYYLKTTNYKRISNLMLKTDIKQRRFKHKIDEERRAVIQA